MAVTVYQALTQKVGLSRKVSGVPTKNWSKRMHGICQYVGVDCRTLPEALTMLGARF